MAKDSRIGECLWSEWSGEGYIAIGTSPILFFTEEHVDVDHDVVKRALASALQRDGVVVSLGDGYRAVESGNIVEGFAGYVDGDNELTFCDYKGETFYGEFVESIIAITWVEIYVGTDR